MKYGAALTTFASALAFFAPPALAFLATPALARADDGALGRWASASREACAPVRETRVLVHVSPDALGEDEARELCGTIGRELGLRDSLDCSRRDNGAFEFLLGVLQPCAYDAVVTVRKGENSDVPRVTLWRHSDPASASRTLAPVSRSELSSPASTARIAALIRLAKAGAPLDDASLVKETLLYGALQQLESIELAPEGFYRKKGGAAAPALTLDEAWDEATREIPGLQQWATALLEIGGVIGAGAAYYYGNRDWSKVDWDLSAADWRNKILLAPYTVSYDTNDFSVNAIGHPMAGMLYYLAARSNRFTPLQSTAIAFVASYLWEESVEFQEKTSINDMLFTPFAGAVIGESVYQWSAYASCHLKARKSLQTCIDRAREADSRLDVGLSSGARWGTAGASGLAALEVAGVLDHTEEPMAGEAQAIPAGDWSALALKLGFAGTSRGEEGNPIAAEAEFRSLLAGIQGLAWEAKSQGIWWIDLDQGFFLRDAPMAGVRDRYAVVELLGATGRLRIRSAGVLFEIRLRLTADVAIIDAWALPGALTRRELKEADSSLRDQGYSHSGGVSAELVVRLSDLRRNWEFEAMVQDRRLSKLAGHDRYPDRATQPVSTTDERARARIEATVRIPRTRLHIGVSGQADAGWSTVADQAVSRTEGQVQGVLRYDF